MTIPARTPSATRSGNALVLTLIIAAGAATMIAVAGDGMFGMSRLSRIALDRQRAGFAAEAVAAMVESRLLERAGDPLTLGRDVDADPTAWWNLRGCCYTHVTPAADPSQPPTLTYVPNVDGLWVNGCLVRWRLEPVKVFDHTLDDTGAPTASSGFTVNFEPDPQRWTQREQLAAAANPGHTLSNSTATMFHFRIVAEAYALADGGAVAAQPWQDPQARTCCVQAQRIVQLEQLALFRYALFHAAEGPDGDIPLQSGNAMSITDGAVHSNGAIYIFGGEFEGFNYTPHNFHLMASGDQWGDPNNFWQSITLGSAAKPINVTGVDGVFRLGKTGTLCAAFEGVPGANYNPMSIPIPPDAPGDWVANTAHDLNGDYPYCDRRHHINGMAFHSMNDSRSPDRMHADFGRWVRDRNNGGAIVKTLANIPELGGRPFEPQRLAPSAHLYQRFLAGTAVSPTTYTISPTTADRQVFYAAAPTSSNPPLTTDPAAAVAPVDAAELPMWWNATFTTTDVAAPADLNAVGTDTDGDGFDDREAKGWYLERAQFGASVDARGRYVQHASLGSTGLVIRERRAIDTSLATTVTIDPVIGCDPNQSPDPAQHFDPLSGPPVLGRRDDWGNSHVSWFWPDFRQYAARFAKYMKSQYVVLFRGNDITQAFFNDIVQQSTQDDFIATEDEFVDDRELGYLHAFYPNVAVDAATGVVHGIDSWGFGPSNGFPPWGRWPSDGTAAAPWPPASVGTDENHHYRMNALTLNLRRVQDWLKGTPAATLCAGDSGMAKDHFNGLIYLGRTRRSQTYDPIVRPDLAWKKPADGAVDPTVGNYRFPSLNDPTGNVRRIREGDGPPETFRGVTRIRGGLRTDANRNQRAALDWNHPTNADGSTGSSPLGTSGLTIATNVRLYTWGDLNTTPHADPNSSDPKYPPMAICADGITILSSAWHDEYWGFFTRDNYAGGQLMETFWTPVWWGFDALADDTTLNTSWVINNIPNDKWNAEALGSSGEPDVFRQVEGWDWRNGRPANLTIMGSMVVMNTQRYSHALNAYGDTAMSSHTRVHAPPNMLLKFNSDLLTAAGQPPFSPFGVQATRVISTVSPDG